VNDIICGLGNTVDYEIVWDSEVFARLISEYDIGKDELLPTRTVDSERDLIIVIAAYLQGGTGGEHRLSGSRIVEDFAARFSTRVTLGGTGVRAGIALASLGIPTVQHLVSINRHTRELLPNSIRVISAQASETFYPHLIVQYPQGARIKIGDREIIAPQANRLIFGDDPPNRELPLSKELPEALSLAKVFLISGFNTMSVPDILNKRLDTLSTAMDHLPENALIYYEDAAFYRPDFAEIVRSRLLPRISVYSCNEDELQTLLGRKVELLNAHAVATALLEAHTLIPASVLVVHSSYWAFAIGDSAANYRDCLASAVQMAGTRYRIGDGHSASDFANTAKFPWHPGGAKVVEQVQKMVSVQGMPAYLVDTPAAATVGLGDSFVGGFLAALS